MNAVDPDYLAMAEEMDAMREAHEEQCRLNSVFRDASAVAVVTMWRTAKHWRTGKVLTHFETEALVERWCALFNRLPTSEAITGERATVAAPLDEHPLLSMPDDSMLRPRDVRRLFGYAKSTLKRHMGNGKFPRPLNVAPGQRYIGWPARQLKEWFLTEQDAGHNAARH